MEIFYTKKLKFFLDKSFFLKVNLNVVEECDLLKFDNCQKQNRNRCYIKI